MPITVNITPLPTPVPQRSDPANFVARADTLLVALPTFVTETNALAVEINTTAQEAAASATAAAESVVGAASQVTLATAAKVGAETAQTNAEAARDAATQAAATAGAPTWVSGNTYAAGDVTFSPLNFYTYRRIAAGAGTLDPSIDPANWVLIGGTPNPAGKNGYLLGVSSDGKTLEWVAPQMGAAENFILSM